MIHRCFGRLALLLAVYTGPAWSQVAEGDWLDDLLTDEQQVISPNLQIERIRDEFPNLLDEDVDPLGFLNQCSKSVSEIWRAKRPSSKKTPEQLSELMLRYDKYCLSTIDQLGQESQRVIERSMAFISADSPESIPFCGALRIEANKFLTARHCFFFRVDNAERQVKKSALYATLLNGSSVEVEILENEPFQLALGRRIPHPKDLILLSSKSASFDPGFESVELKRPDAPLDDVILIGHHVNAHSERLLMDPDDARPDWISRVRWDSSPTCALIYKTKKGCLAHTCQSTKGYSGGPVYHVSGNDISVVGIHVDDGRSPVGCASSRNLETMNLAIEINIPGT